MLVLQRKMYQRINIGDDIEVTVVGVDVETGAVKLGIEAPRDVIILRSELEGGGSKDTGNQEVNGNVRAKVRKRV